jgi:hypothetical protein
MHHVGSVLREPLDITFHAGAWTSCASALPPTSIW